jgi:two-component system chemotaxis response regulator CheB
MKIKLLIVDDSRIFRTGIEESLADENDIEVIGSVWNGLKAIEFIRSNPPDLVTLDVEMPDMDGLETLAAIQKINASIRPSKPIGVIMVSSFTQKGADITIKALEAGAFDFITKPGGKNPKKNMELLRRQLVTKIRYFTSKRISEGMVVSHGAMPPLPETTPALPILSGIEAILIGVSTGGPSALASLLPPLCNKLDVPIFIVQHMPAPFTQSLARSLNANCRYSVMEARNNDVIRKRTAYIAPGGRHMLLRRGGHTVRTVVSDQPPEKGCKPSVDILFRSGASVYGENVVAIILTGMGVDGTQGAAILKRAGALVIAQDEETSVVWGMPGSVKASGHADRILPLDQIPDTLIAMMLGRTPE